MVERTSTGNAPWTLVEANDKNYARIKILRTLCERLESELAHSPKAGGKASVKSDKAEKSYKSDKAGKHGTSDKNAGD